MASAEVLDFEKLLAPISDDQPTGEELDATDADFQGLKDAYNEARTAERKIEQNRFMEPEEREEVDPPDWEMIRENAEMVIAEKSKDLRAAAWLIEALTRLEGFPGARDGFRLVREISEQYWEGIHPALDEDYGYEDTVAQLGGLNGVLPAAIEQAPITSGSEGPFSGMDFKVSKDLEKLDPSEREERVAGGSVSKEMFDKDALSTSPEFYENLLEDVEQCGEELQKMENVLDEKCIHEDEYQSPSVSNLKEVLDDTRLRVEPLLEAVKQPDGELAPTDGEGGGEGGDGALVPSGGGGAFVVPSGAPANREGAFKVLLEVSNFFRKTEPHSPVSYALEQVVKWGRMELPDLMKVLVSDDSARDDMFRLTGIPEPPDEDDDD